MDVNILLGTKEEFLLNMQLGSGEQMQKGISRIEIEVQFTPIIGRICTDQCVIDVTDFDDVQIGIPVVWLIT